MTHGRQGFLDGYLEKTAWSPFGNASKGVTAGTQGATAGAKAVTGPVADATPGVTPEQPVAEPSAWSRIKEMGGIIMSNPNPKTLIENQIVGNTISMMTLPLDDPRRIAFEADPRNASTIAEGNKRMENGFFSWMKTPGNVQRLAGEAWKRYKKPIAFGGAALLGMAAMPFMFSAMNRNKQVPQQAAVASGGRQPEAWEYQTPFRMSAQQRQQMQWQQMQNYQTALAKSRPKQEHRHDLENSQVLVRDRAPADL